MKLIQFSRQRDYIFNLTFTNGTSIETDLAPLLAPHVAQTDLATGRIDPEWGCLEFKDGAVDIEPKTLYQWAESHSLCSH